MYATGLGATNPAGSSSSGGASSPPLNLVQDPLTVYIGDTPATVGFAGLAPGFPGIYQLNVTPNGPLSDRIYLQSGGWQSNITSLATAPGGNVANVTGSIDGIYPATGVNQAMGGSSSVTYYTSVMFTGATFTAAFDILPGAKPFSMVATSETASAVVNIDPVHGTWQATLTAPTAAAAQFNYSSLTFPVLDFLSCISTGCSPFPANIIPLSRVDPFLAKVLSLIPLPTGCATQGLAINGVATLSGSFSGSHLTWNNPAPFGGFQQISQANAGSRTTTFNLYIDGVQVAAKIATIAIF